MSWFSRKKKKPAQGQPQQQDAFDANVRLGDAANASKNWPLAAKHYKLALENRPNSPAIQVQLGHSLKEQGLLADAEKAYHEACKFDPSNADAHLHRGHALKLLKKTSSAIEAYTVAARLGSTNAIGNDGRRELVALGITPPVSIAVKIPSAVADEHRDLARSIKDSQWKAALGIIGGPKIEMTPELKLAKAQILQLLGRFDEALPIFQDKDVRSLGAAASQALKSFYVDCGDDEMVRRLAVGELRQGIDDGTPFEFLGESVALLARLGHLDLAFASSETLFGTGQKSKDMARTAAGVKAQRVGGTFPDNLLSDYRRDFQARSAALETEGHHAQAALMREEGDALDIATKSRAI